MRKLDIAAAVFLLGLSALIVFETRDLPYWAGFTPGPAFATFWVSASGALIGVALLIQGFLSERRPVELPDRAGVRQVLLCIASLWLLLAALPWLGTLLSGLLFMLVFLLGIARRPLVPSIFTSVLTVGIIEAVFGFWLHIDLPEGMVGF